MKETIRLFDRDAYLKTFDAVVLSCTEGKKGYEVILDQTCFFPEEGGQSPDTGVINGLPVRDVRIKAGVITHILPEAIPEGSTVHGEINWEHRFSNMQNHSGEHLVSGIIHNRFGYDNVGFHLSDQTVTLDLNGEITDEEAAEIELEANRAVVQNIETQILYPTKEELANISYRSKIEIEGQVRLVCFPGIDICACCAPHVARTGEIGIIRILHRQTYKGGVRLTILCGFRALADCREKAELVRKVSVSLSVKPELIDERVEHLKAEVIAQKVALNRYEEAEVLRISEEYKAGCGDVILFLPPMNNDHQRRLVNLIAEKSDGICGVFCGDDAQGYRYIIGSISGDCRIIGNALRMKGGKGGGSAKMVQGSALLAESEIRTVWGDTLHE